MKKFMILLAALPLLCCIAGVKVVDSKNWRNQGAEVSVSPEGTLLMKFSKKNKGYLQARRGVAGGLAGFNRLSFKVKSSAAIRDLNVIFWSNGQRAIADSTLYAGDRFLPAGEWVECIWDFRQNPGWVTPARKTPFGFDAVNAIAFNCDSRNLTADEVTVEIKDLRFETVDPTGIRPRRLYTSGWLEDGAEFTAKDGVLSVTYSKSQGKYPQVRKNFSNGLKGYNRFSCEVRFSVPMPGLALILQQGRYRAIASARDIAKVREFKAGEWIEINWDFRKSPGWITPPRNTAFEFDKASIIAFNCTTASLPDGDHIMEVRNMRFEYVDESVSAEAIDRKNFAAQIVPGSIAGKKIVVWPNHGVPEGNTLEIFVNNIDLYKALPIDGVNLDMAPAPFRDSFFSPFPIDDSAFEKAKTIVKNTDWGNLKNNFFRIDIASGWGKNSDGSRRQFDWFDDAAWEIILDKITRFAAVCKECNFNIMFDTEAYTTEPYDYYRYYRNSGKSFAEYQKQVRLRGRQVAEAFAKGNPDAVIMMMFSTWVVNIAPEQDRYGLLPAFIDGLCDAKTRMTIIDGFEAGYEFTDRASVINGLYTMKKIAPVKSSNPERYREVIKNGFGVWLRHTVFTPEQFNKVVNAALEFSDGYVWVYLQQNPVTDPRVKACFDAVKRN